MRHAPDAAPDGSAFELLPAAFALLSAQGQVVQANALFRALAGAAAERGAWLAALADEGYRLVSIEKQ